MEILTASHLTKQYGQGPNLVKALDDVSISIHQGEFVAIIGTSGSGKSTLLNMLGGLDRPTSGSVKVDRFELGKLKDEDLTVFRRQRIGFIFQNYNLVPILSAYENIVLPMQLDRKRPDERFLEKVVALLGLEKKLNSMPNQLSGGQQQRVAIARALASKHCLGRRAHRQPGFQNQPGGHRPSEADQPRVPPNHCHDYPQPGHCRPGRPSHPH